jgi:hypothetical protein
MELLRRIIWIIGLCWVSLAARAQLYRDLIGYDQIGSGGPQILLSRGAGVPVGQVEVFPPGTSNYIPDTSLAAFSGKTFTLRSGASGISPHATQVASSFYSSVSGSAPDVSQVTLFSAESFLNGLLRVGRKSRAPGKSGVMVINNSWVASFENESTNVDVVRRLDDLINRDGVLIFNAVENVNDGSFPKLLSTSYNGVTVGTAQGSHGPFTYESTGARAKPDLIVPLQFTSDATAVASGAGALLLSEARARQIPMNQLAAKAVLMAGAQRDDTWQRGLAGATDDAKAPLDFVQGAGRLRIDRSFELFTAGRQLPGVAVNDNGVAGWDTARTDKTTRSAVYQIDLDQAQDEWGAVLTWNRVIPGLNSKNRYNSTPTMADMVLSLFKKRPGRKPYLVANSDSDFDNVETLTLHDLAAGDYQLVVSGNVRTRYGVAWLAGADAAGGMGGVGPMSLSGVGSGEVAGFAQAPEPSFLMMVLPIAGVVCLNRRR